MYINKDTHLLRFMILQRSVDLTSRGSGSKRTYIFIVLFLLALVNIIRTYPEKLHKRSQFRLRQHHDNIEEAHLIEIISNSIRQFGTESTTSILDTDYSDRSYDAILLDSQTSQGKAFHWLMHHDKYIHRHPRLSNADIVQRYVLTLLFFHTEGTYNDNFASEFTPLANVRATWSRYGDLGFLSYARHECTWNTKVKGRTYGVICSQGKVEELKLGGVGIDGSIPEEIGLLSGLKILEMQDNHLKEQIPSSLGMLKELQVLNLMGNLFVGPLPNELGSLVYLESLLLHSNRIHGGEVPIPLCALVDQGVLTEFWMDCGQLNDPIACPCCTRCCSDDYCVPVPIGGRSRNYVDDPYFVDTEDRIDDHLTLELGTARQDSGDEIELAVANIADVDVIIDTANVDVDDFEDVDNLNYVE